MPHRVPCCADLVVQANALLVAGTVLVMLTLA